MGLQFAKYRFYVVNELWYSWSPERTHISTRMHTVLMFSWSETVRCLPKISMSLYIDIVEIILAAEFLTSNLIQLLNCLLVYFCALMWRGKSKLRFPGFILCWKPLMLDRAESFNVFLSLWGKWSNMWKALHFHSLKKNVYIGFREFRGHRRN